MHAQYANHSSDKKRRRAQLSFHENFLCFNQRKEELGGERLNEMVVVVVVVVVVMMMMKRV
jgi:hypothetical protein